MRLDVFSKNLPTSPAVERHTERRLLFALGRFRRRIEAVNVRLADLNGPRGGMDKRCAVECDLGPLGSLMVAETDSDLYAAIDRAADKIKVAVRRKVDRAKHIWHGRR